MGVGVVEVEAGVAMGEVEAGVGVVEAGVGVVDTVTPTLSCSGFMIEDDS
jgi:hypothetical protein